MRLSISRDILESQLRFLFFGVLLGTFMMSIPVNAQGASTSNVITLPPAQLREFVGDIETAKRHLQRHQLKRAISDVDALLVKLQGFQTALIEGYFPRKYRSFRRSRPTLDQGEFGETDGYGVVYACHYQHPRTRQTIEVNVVYGDTSIDDYVNVLKNPSMLEGLDNTTIVEVNGGYKALEKYAPDEGYCERNILVNSDVLVNVIGTGFYEKSDLDSFMSGIPFEKLSSYFQ